MTLINRAKKLIPLTAALAVSACSSTTSNLSTNQGVSDSFNVGASYVGQAAQYVMIDVVSPPSQCFEPENQSGAPVRFNRQSIIDQPHLIKREKQKVPGHPVADRSFYCAAFSYSVDERGHVTDISTLYNSHPGIAGIDFARDARRTLRQWRYQPGQVDKAPAKFTGLSTVFYYEFKG